MRFGIKPVYGRMIAYSFIPLILVIIGTYGGIYVLSPNLTTDLSEEYHAGLIQDHLFLSEEKVEQLDAFFETWETGIRFLENQIVDILEDPPSPARLSYFHDITTDKLTPRAEYSEKYNNTVDFSVSSYFVYPVVNFGNWSVATQYKIDISSYMDFAFISLYSTREDIYRISLNIDDQIERRYPFQGPRNLNYDPFNSTFHNMTKASNSSQIFYSLPFADARTNTTLITLSKSIFMDNLYRGTVSISYQLKSLVQELSLLTTVNHRSFLLTNSDQVIYHTNYTSSKDVLNESRQLQEVYAFETNSTEFSNLILGTSSTLSTAELDYGEDNYLVSVIKIREFTFGLVTLDIKPTITGTFDLVALLIMPILIVTFFVLLILLLLRRYGILRNVGLETLIMLEQSLTDKLDKVANLDGDEIGETIKEGIQEKGEELREKAETVTEEKIDDVKSQMQNIDKFVVAKINEKLDSFENKLLQSKVNKFDSVEDFAQAAKDKLNLQPDRITNLVNNPLDFVENQGKIFNLDLSNLENIADLPNKTTRLVSTLISQNTATIEQLEAFSSIPIEELEKILTALPPEYGIERGEEDIRLEKDNIIPNIQAILQIFFQISPETSLEDQMGTIDSSSDHVHNDNTEED